MCEICVELDKKIERYRGIILSINDQLTLKRADALIVDLEAQKTALHRKQKKGNSVGS
jgi:hypothetical protein